VKRWLATQLRRLLVWLGEESDLDLHARTLGMVRLPPRRGTVIELVQDLERTVAACLPAGANWKLEWDLKDTITIHLNHRPTEQEREMLRKGTKR
jgi:hypothetical protein